MVPLFTFILALLVVPFVQPFTIRSWKPNPPTASFQSKRKIKVDLRYDKKADITVVRLQDIVLLEDPTSFERLRMSLAFAYSGQRIVTPKSVSVLFSSASRSKSPFRTETLEARVDGARLDLGKLQGFNDDTTAPGIFLASRHGSFSYENFSSLAQAKKVRLLVGGGGYELSADQRQSLHDFLELMQQVGQELK